MDALTLARLEFGITTSLHFLFVALTLGLAPLIAFLQTRWVRTGNPLHERLTKFWGQIYVINYGLGIISGLLLEFQFSLNWSGLTHFAGELFGAPLAMETLFAFFVESTFLGLWIFGWGKMPKVLHLISFYIVGARRWPPPISSSSRTDFCRTRWVSYATAMACAWSTSARCSPIRPRCWPSGTFCPPRSW
ncbi:cytochrome ubiquinol oxidase subunit I [Nonomuraea jiangxiensis]|uniref:Cytochrome bd terminal oxidase subunit I n=1 Tax=Nonomuraea jiangxiensis TaxID=633440 RepID=A0A1G9PVW3_9ACTN|nr:cytochrome ubiquinol oxidase subunit I [Nonomuraea jiangxiensis]SDM02387.1 Cytochrome bd terminal oxidase subunit I [Nonomuraea jiangxiensis]